MKKATHENKMMPKPPENKRAKIKINKPVGGYQKGAIVNIKVDNKGIPLDLYWRRRLKDSKVDNCIEFITEKEAK